MLLGGQWGFRPHLAVLGGYSDVCACGSFLEVLGDHVLIEIKPESAAFKASALTLYSFSGHGCASVLVPRGTNKKGHSGFIITGGALTKRFTRLAYLQRIILGPGTLLEIRFDARMNWKHIFQIPLFNFAYCVFNSTVSEITLMLKCSLCMWEAQSLILGTKKEHKIGNRERAQRVRMGPERMQVLRSLPCM